MRLVVVLVLLFPGLAWADPAKDLAAQIMPEAGWSAMIESMSVTVSQQLAQSGHPMEPGPIREAMKKILPYDELLKFQAETFRKHYEPKEIAQLASFYRSPLGQKTLRLMPQVSSEVMQWVTQTVSTRAPSVFGNKG